MATVLKLIKAVQTRVPSVVVSTIYSVSSLKLQFKVKLLQELDDHCTELCKKKTPSMLRKNDYPNKVNFDLETLLCEIQSRCPILLDVMSTIIKPNGKANVTPALGLCYDILMQRRNHDLMRNSEDKYHSAFRRKCQETGWQRN